MFNQIFITTGAVKSLLKDGAGGIYIGTKTGPNIGKLYRKRKAEITFKDITGTINGIVTCLLEDEASNIYLGTETSIDNGKLYKSDNII